MNMESPVKNSSTEESKSPHKEEKQSFLQRTQKVMENMFLCCCCCQDTLECFVPPPSKPHYFGLKSSETHCEETTPHLDTTCISEHAVESLCEQDLWQRSNGILGCSYFLLPGEVPVEPTDAQDLHKTSPNIININTVDATSIAEERVEKKSSTKKHLSWKEIRSFFQRARKAVILHLLCSTVDIIEPFVPQTESTVSLCNHSAQTLLFEETRDGISNRLCNLKIIPEMTLPGEVLSEPRWATRMEASFVEISSAEQPTERTTKNMVFGSYINNGVEEYET